MENLLISPISDLTILLMSITRYSPEKVILLTGDYEAKKTAKTRETLTDIFGRFINFEFYEVDDKDLIKISSDVSNVIKKERENGYRIIVNINTDVKVQILGLIFGLYDQYSYIDEIFFVDRETKDFVSIPILKFGLSPTKKQVLKIIAGGESTVQNLSKTLNISRGMIYNHIRELREMGLLKNDELAITSAGRLGIISMDDE
jgi:CRISPR-associated protein Csa3